MSKDVPVGQGNRAPSLFKRLSAGSVEAFSGDGSSGGSKTDTPEVDYRKYVASVHLASLNGLERAVESTAESAKMLDKARAVVEEVSLANRAAAQSEALGVDVAAETAERLLNRILDKPDRARQAQSVACLGKSLQGLLG